MPRSRSARQGLIAYRVANFFRHWVTGSAMRGRAGERSRQALASAIDSLEVRQVLNGTIEGIVWHDVLEVDTVDANTGQPVVINAEDGAFQNIASSATGGEREYGAQGVRVFVDANNNLEFDYTDNNTNGRFDAGDTALEIFDVTDVDGFYQLEQVPDGLNRVRIDLPEAGETYTVTTFDQFGQPIATPYVDGAYMTAPPVTGAAQASQFQIDIVYTGFTPTAVEQAAFQSAADRWAEIIVADLPDVVSPTDSTPIDDVRIYATLAPDDGVGGTLGFAGPTALRSLAQGGLPSEGRMSFDSADVAGLIQSGTFDDVILHEMGHVLGIGTLWQSFNLTDFSDLQNPLYIGANAVREYESIFGLTTGSVPVEESGGPGTALGHWNEETLFDELMTGFLSGPTQPISRITVGSLDDMGYGVNYAAADPFNPLGSLRAPGSSNEPYGVVKALFGDYVISEPLVGSSSLTAPSSLVSPRGYDIIINDGDVSVDNLFGIAPIPGTGVDPITNRPPLAVDQEFEIIEVDAFYDAEVGYPDEAANSVYIVGQVQATDVNDPSDTVGSNLFYKIVGGNLGDEEKAFDIVKDKSEETKDKLAALLGYTRPGDDALIDARLASDLRPGTIYINNEAMINRDINQIAGGFNLQVLVADEDPDGSDVNMNGRVEPNEPDADGDFGVAGAYDLIDVKVTLVSYNRIAEAPGNNDSFSVVRDAVDGSDNTFLLNTGDQNTHQRLNFDYSTQEFIDPFLTRNSLGDPSNNQFGATRQEWFYVDGSIEDRGTGSRDVDFYRIDLASPTGLFLNIDAKEVLRSSLDARLRVYDASGNLIAQPNFDNSGQSASDRGYDLEYFAAPAQSISGNASDVAGTNDGRSDDPSLYLDLPAGKYYISVEGLFDSSIGDFTTGDYHLRILGDQRYSGNDLNVTPGGAFHNTIDIDNDGVPDNQVAQFYHGSTATVTEQYTIYLDFDGQTNVPIPAQFQTTLTQGNLTAFDFDGDPSSFTPGERLAMQNIFRIVREDVGPLNINLTTDLATYQTAVTNGTGAYRIYVTESDPQQFTNNQATAQFRNMEGTGYGIVFASNVLNFSPGDSNPISGRMVAAPIETGNYVSDLIGRNAGLDPFSGSAPATGNIYPDAIVGQADQGLNSEFWKRGGATVGGLQTPLRFDLRNPYTTRNGTTNAIDAIFVDRDQQWNVNDPNWNTNDGGWVVNGDTFLNKRPLNPQAPNFVGFEDPRALSQRLEIEGTIDALPWSNSGTVVNEADFDLIQIFPTDSTRIYVDVDEYATNLDLRVQLFVVQENATNDPVAGLVDISLTYDPVQGLLRNGTALSQAEIDRAYNDGIVLSGNDAYIDFRDYSSPGGLLTYWINVTARDSDNPQLDPDTQWSGNYKVTMIKQSVGNQQPDGPDQTTIELDEQPTADRQPTSPAFAYDMYNDWHKIGQVDLGETAGYFADRQNRRDNGLFGQHWNFTLTSVNGSQQGSSTPIVDFDEFLFVDSGTGDVFLTDPSRLDFELYSVYTLSVVVEDNGKGRTGNPLTAVVTIDIVLRDVNELPIGTNQTFTVRENRPVGTVVGNVTISDPDDQVFTYNISRVRAVRRSDGRVYTVTGEGIFSIDSLGQIIVQDPPENPNTIENPENPNVGYLDYEFWQSFIVDVTATEDRVNGQTSNPIEVTINLSDVNEKPNFAPQIDNAPTIEVSENASVGDFVYDFGYWPNTVTVGMQDPSWRIATNRRTIADPVRHIGVFDDDNIPPADPLLGPSGTETLTFSITDATENGGPSGGALGVFSIDPATGILTIADSDRINFEAQPGGQLFQLTIRVQDDGDATTNAAPLFDTVVLNIGIKNESPEPPVLADAIASIDENAPNGTLLYTLMATGDDLPVGTMQYSIVSAVSGENDDDATGIFTVNPTTGQIRVADGVRLSYEQYLPLTDAQIRLTVRASIGTPALSDTAVITVNINDLVETPPTPVTNPQVFTIAENNATPQLVGLIRATETDPGQSIVRWQIISGNTGGEFSVSQTGRVYAMKQLDFETKRQFQFRVRFFDNDIPATSGEVDVIVNVTNVNEPPVLPSFVVSVPENSPAGTRVTPTTIRPFDPEGNNISYQIISGNIDGAFEIRRTTSTGAGFNIFVANSEPLDHEVNPSILLRVRMTDNGVPQESSDVYIRVDITDVDEFADIITRDESTGRWYLYQSTGADFTKSQFGLWSTSANWTNIMSGDFNGDDLTDVVTQYPNTGAWFVGVARNSQMATSRWNDTWTNPQQYTDHLVGDFDGDGLDDIAARNTTTGQWRVSLSTGSAFVDTAWSGEFDSSITWTIVKAGDFNGDGLSDVVGFDAVTGQGYLGLSTGSGFNVSTWGDSVGRMSRLDNFLIADFDGDGDDDLVYRDVERQSTYGAWHYVVDEVAGPGVNDQTNLPRSATNPGFANQKNWRSVNAGDFDGNGLADIVLQDADSKNWYVIYSETTHSEVGTEPFAKWYHGMITGEVEVGDFNGDGLDDIAALRLSNQYTEERYFGWYMGLSVPGRGPAQPAVWGSTIPGDDGDTAPDYANQIVGEFTVRAPQPLNRVAMSPIDVPYLPNAQFTIREESPNDTVVGLIDVDSRFTTATQFRIISGDPDGAFDLTFNSNGKLVLFVDNGSLMDFETQPVFNLVIEAIDPAFAMSVTATIQVNLTNAVDLARTDVVSRDAATGNWYAYRSTGSGFVRQQVANWPTSVDWGHVMTGDFNGDGLTDVIATHPGNNRFLVGLMRPTYMANQTWGDASWGNFASYTDFLVGDFNGDGRDDIAARRISDGVWRVGISNGVTFVDSVWGTWGNGNWTAAKVGDFDGDGRDDIVGMNAGNGQFIWSRSRGTQFANSRWGINLPNFQSLSDFVVGDFDGDGDDDLGYRDTSATGSAGAWHLAVDELVGPGVNERTNLAGLNNAATYRNVVVADFDFNGKDDIAVQNATTKDWYVLISRNGDSNPRLYANWADTLETGPVVVGDFNADGLADIAARRQDPIYNGAWQVGIAQPGDQGYPKQFRAFRWDVNDPVTPSNYINDFAAQTDVPGIQPTNEKAANPSAPLTMSADSPVRVTLADAPSSLRAATESESDDDATASNAGSSSNNSSGDSSADVLDELVGSSVDLHEFLKTLG